jgi:nicotinamidase-related amidase
VLLLDCLEGVAAGVLPEAEARERFSGAVVALLELAAASGIPVVRVDVEFRPGHPEVASSNAYFSTVKAAGRLQEGSGHTAPMREIEDLVQDSPRVVKRRIGAFSGNDLESLLRGLGRSHLVLAGLITRGAVLSTACQAADLDYRVTVVSDACADPDAEAHRVLLSSVLPLRGDVVTLADLSSKPPTTEETQWVG